MITNLHERQDTSDDEHCSLVGGKKYLNVVHGEDKISFDSSSRRGKNWNILIGFLKSIY